jgi:hypothetical protein
MMNAVANMKLSKMAHHHGLSLLAVDPDLLGHVLNIEFGLDVVSLAVERTVDVIRFVGAVGFGFGFGLAFAFALVVLTVAVAPAVAIDFAFAFDFLLAIGSRGAFGMVAIAVGVLAVFAILAILAVAVAALAVELLLAIGSDVLVLNFAVLPSVIVPVPVPVPVPVGLGATLSRIVEIGGSRIRRAESLEIIPT